MNFMIKDVHPETVGYAVDDLDDDGIPELAIGTIFTDEIQTNQYCLSERMRTEPIPFRLASID